MKHLYLVINVLTVVVKVKLPFCMDFYDFYYIFVVMSTCLMSLLRSHRRLSFPLTVLPDEEEVDLEEVVLVVLTEVLLLPSSR